MVFQVIIGRHDICMEREGWGSNPHHSSQKKVKINSFFFLHGPMGVITWGIVKTRRASTGKQGEQGVEPRGWGTDPTPNYKTGYQLSIGDSQDAYHIMIRDSQS